MELSVSVIMLLWLSDDRKLCTCVQLTCVGCAAGISPLVRVSTIKSPPHESDMRNIHISPGPHPVPQREIPTIVICNQPQYRESCDKHQTLSLS